MSEASVLQQRRIASVLPMVREWSECAASYMEGPRDPEEDAWWPRYDASCGLMGWEYRVVNTKPRKDGGPK